MLKIILASSSPRRKDLLFKMGIPYDAIPASIDEEVFFSKWLQEGKPPKDIVRQLSLLKAKSLSKEYPGQFILGADTLVTVDERILGKPTNQLEAKSFLQLMSGRSHFVITGYTWFCSKKNYSVSDVVETEVWVRKISEEEIERYVQNENVLDAAGAYKIQSFYPDYITKIKGSYFNVVGLPVQSVFESYKHLTEN